MKKIFSFHLSPIQFFAIFLTLVSFAFFSSTTASADYVLCEINDSDIERKCNANHYECQEEGIIDDCDNSLNPIGGDHTDEVQDGFESMEACRVRMRELMAQYETGQFPTINCINPNDEDDCKTYTCEDQHNKKDGSSTDYNNNGGCPTGYQPTNSCKLTIVLNDEPVSDMIRKINPVTVCKGSTGTLACIVNIIVKNIIFPACGILLFVMIVFGGFKMVQSSFTGNQNGVELGRKRITGAIYGYLLLAVAFLLWRIVEIVFGFQITG